MFDPATARRTRRAVVLVVCFVAAAGHASTARANGRFPTAQQLVVMPGKPDTMVLRTTFGLLVSSDRGQQWDFVCEGAAGYASQEDPPIAVTAGSAIFVGAEEGLAVSPDTGCSWAAPSGEIAGASVVDVAVRPDAPHAALALVERRGGATEAGAPIFAPRLFATTDDGAHWAAYGAPLDADVRTATVDVAATEPHRAYVTGARGTSPKATSLFVTFDDGAHWTERAIPTNPSTEPTAYVAAVDPGNADRIYVRAGAQTSRLFVSDDAGQTFRVAYQGGPMLGFALGQAGAEVYLGGPDDGLRAAPAATLAFTPRSPIPVGCLTASGASLYACVVQSGVLVALATDATTFTPLLRLTSIRGPLACAGASIEAACASAWSDLRQRFAIGEAPDAGRADAGAPAEAPGPHGGGAGCSESPIRDGSLGLVAFGAFVTLLVRARLRLTCPRDS